jgi:4-diphosphocytidyl-2-C-methyl-D-erythritol kinase
MNESSREAEANLFFLSLYWLVDCGRQGPCCVWPSRERRVQIRRRAAEIEILAPAKINLFFEVLSRRDDGFHEIETLMLPIDLCDTLILANDPSGNVTISTRWVTGIKQQSNVAAPSAPAASDEYETIPEGDKNHAVRAVRLLAQRAGINRGATMRLVKRIPAAAGLGGGSSDAAAALVAANLAWSLNWSTQRLADVAAEIGSDVPFFLSYGPAVCSGRGEKIMPVAGLGTLHLVVLRPPAGLSTPAVYRACQPGNPPRKVDPVMESLRNGDLAAVGPRLHNRLLEPARRLSPWIDRVIDRLTEAGCGPVGMSGSGSSCFAVCRSAVHARQTAARLRCRHPEMSLVWSVRTI